MIYFVTCDRRCIIRYEVLRSRYYCLGYRYTAAVSEYCCLELVLYRIYNICIHTYASFCMLEAQSAIWPSMMRVGYVSSRGISCVRTAAYTYVQQAIRQSVPTIIIVYAGRCETPAAALACSLQQLLCAVHSSMYIREE